MTRDAEIRVPKVELAGVSKAFGALQVLDQLDLVIPAGQTLVVLGGSGTGKSVLLKHIVGLLRPDRGRVAIDGRDWSEVSSAELPTFRRKFGMSFQEGALFDSMTVFENVAFPLRRAGWGEARVRERVAECLELVHLPGVERRMPSELSGGMRRRVGFARAIALEPEILLFDEPTTGLDPVMRAALDEVILELKERLRPTAVVITHDLDSAFRIADRLAFLYRGKILVEGPREVFRDVPDPRLQQFLRGEAQGPLTQQTN